MTPVELLGIICVLAVVRVVLSIRPLAAGVDSTTVGARRVPAVAATTSSDPDSIAPPPSSASSLSAIIKEYLDAFIVAGLVALLLITFVVRTFFIPSGSMEPTLQINDVLLVNEFEYRLHKPNDGDIVVFWPPTPTPNEFIKRLIGSPGDTLRVDNGTVYRNGVALQEPYIMQKPTYKLEVKNYGIYVDDSPLDPTTANIPPRKFWTSPDTIPPNCYFMMGDNRNNSDDSHAWGFAQFSGKFATGPNAGQAASFTGRAFLLFWPPNRLRILH